MMLETFEQLASLTLANDSNAAILRILG